MSYGFRFTDTPGLRVALVDMHDDRAYFTFDGDLNQLGIIYQRLSEAGFDVVKNDVYPGFPKDQEETYRQGLRFLFDNQVTGWWNQRSALLKYQICTEQEFKLALDRQVEDSRG